MQINKHISLLEVVQDKYIISSKKTFDHRQSRGEREEQTQEGEGRASKSVETASEKLISSR